MDTASKKFFISGGAGFVGSSMVELLLSKGAGVTVYDNLSSGKYSFVKKHLGNKKFEFVKADLLNASDLQAAVSKAEPDVMIHLAANPDVRLGAKVTDLDLKQGTLATYNLLEAGRKNDVKGILFSSSSVVYGLAEIKPTPEDYGPLKPISLYGASKLACEGLITSFGHLFGMRYYIYRFANVVGINGTHGIIIDMLDKLRKNDHEIEVLGNGRQRKSYIDVKDCVNSMISIYEKSSSNENIFNLATDDQITVEEIVKMILNKVSPKTKIRYTNTQQGWPGDVPNAFLSNKKMKEFGIVLKYTKSKDVVDNAINILSSK